MSQNGTIISVSNYGTGGGVVATSVGWVTSEALLGAVGLLVAVVFGCVGVYYRRKDDKRKAHAHTLMQKWYKDQKYDGNIPRL